MTSWTAPPFDEAVVARPSARREGEVVRAFFAIALPDATQRVVGERIARLAAAPEGRRVRWVRPEGLHVTLRFLGNVPVDRVAPLADAAHDLLAARSDFTISFGPPEGFPDPRRPRVVAAQAEPCAPLASVAARLDELACEFGLPAERRRFRPHLTLGRVRGAPRWWARDETPLPSVSADAVVLLRSDLAPDGARYTPLARCPLGGSPAIEPDR